VKIARLVMLVAFSGMVASVALADSVPTDPKLLTQGCGGKGQPACDASVLTNPSQVLNLVLTFEPVTANGVTTEVATDSIINESGMALSTFNVSFLVPTGLVFEGCQTGGLFTCTSDNDGNVGAGGTAYYTLTGATICTTDKNDWSINNQTGIATKVYDGDADDNCQSAFNIQLIADSDGSDNIPPGTTVTGNLSAPEPSSGLLLFLGLSAGLLGFKRFSNSAA